MLFTLIFMVIGIAIIVAGVIIFIYGQEINLRRITASAVVVLLGVVVFLASFGWTQVTSGEIGVVSFWAKVQDEEMQPGLTWRPPFVSSVKNWDTKVRTYSFDKIEAFTSENQPALLSGIINYYIDPEKASDLQTSYPDDFEQKLVVSQGDSALKGEARYYTVDLITAKRDQLAASALAELRNSTANDERCPECVVVDTVSIRNIDLSPDYLNSVEAKQKAQQDVQRALAEADSVRAKAKGDADAQATRAQGEADATRALAEGQKDANNAINASLTENLIRWQTIQKLADNIEVMLLPSDQGMLFNLDIPQPQASPAP